MNENHLIHVIRMNLNRGARAVPEPVVDRLARARSAALARQKQSVGGAMLASIGRKIDLEDLPRWFGGFFAALVLSIACVSYWHAQQYLAEVEEVDSAILTDELPLGAIVDKGFDAWLHSSAEH